MVEDKSKVYETTGQIRDELIDTLTKFSGIKYVPAFTSHGYEYDWEIIGRSFEKYFGFESDFDFRGPVKIPETTFEQWYTAVYDVRNLVHWLSVHLFYPSTIIGNNHATDRVIMRIGISKLNKLNLPKKYVDTMFDNIIDTYYARKKGYDEYYYKYILELPF